jgi:hypothetical protein
MQNVIAAFRARDSREELQLDDMEDSINAVSTRRVLQSRRAFFGLAIHCAK